MWNGKNAEAKVAIQRAMKLAATLKNPNTDVVSIAQFVMDQLEPKQASDVYMDEGMATGAQPSLGSTCTGSMQGAYKGPTREALAAAIKQIAVAIMQIEPQNVTMD